MKYENLFENSADGILVLNDKSEIIELNHKICEILGYNKEELILLKGYEFIHPEDLANKDHAAALELLLQGKTLLSQYRLQKKEGEYIPTELSTKKIGDGQFLNIVRDVSERVLAEKKIQESEIKYRSFFENSMDAILLTGSDGQIYSANPAACAMFECSEHEMMELGMAGLMDSDDFRLSVLLSTSVQKGKISREITMVRKDRTPFDAEISSAVFENTEAKQFSSVIIRDITARKQAEKLLRESEEKFKLIFHTRPDYVTIVEIEGGTYIDVNDSFIQKSGHAREEIVGHTASDLDIWVNPEDRNRLFEGLFQSGKIENLEAQFRQKDGQIIEGLMSAATMVLNKKPHLIAITRDITELKEVQKVALETQSKLLSAINNTTDAVAISDAYGNLIDFNEAFALFHKFKKKAECPKTNSEYPAILDCFSSTGKLISAEMWAIPRALRGETVSNSVIDLRRKDTGETWVGSFSFSPIRDKDNAIVGSVVVARDITEQKRTEQAYKETAANLRSMIDNREDSIWAIDRDFKHIIFNTTYERIVNNLYKIRLKKGMSFTEKLTEKQFNFWVPKFESVFQGNTVSFEFSDVLYGTVSYFRISLNPIIEDNLIIGASGLSIDITDIKLAEEALKLSEEKFEKTFRLSPYMVVLSTIEGQVIDVNNRVFATLGYPREEFIGNTTVGLDLWPNAAVRESFVSLLEVDEDIHEMEVQFRKKSGEISDFSISACTIELYQQKLILSIIHDISTRKTAENLIKEHNAELESKVNERTAQLEAINKELKTFSYSVSHDLKAPLRGIDGYSKLLSDFYQKDLNPEAQSFIQKIRSSTLQMNQIIDDLLDYSRLERAEHNFGLANISDLIESVLSIYRAELEAGIFVFNSKNTTIEIVTDSKGFIIAFRNLIDNAIKFTKGRENPLIEISIEEQQNSWIISVSDNGIGFDMKYHHKVFEIFQRLQRVEDYPGTGIGLALVSKSMQRMGGKAWAESLPNIGSTFYLEMPKNHDYVI